MGTQREGDFLIKNRRKINKLKRMGGEPKGRGEEEGAEEGRKVLEEKIKNRKEKKMGEGKPKGGEAGIKDKMKNGMRE